MNDIFVMAGIGLAIAAPTALLLRRLFRGSWGGFLLGVALGWTFVALCGASLALLAAPEIERSIAECEARGGYDCEDARLGLVAILLTTILAALKVPLLGLALRLIAGPRST